MSSVQKVLNASPKKRQGECHWIWLKQIKARAFNWSFTIHPSASWPVLQEQCGLCFVDSGKILCIRKSLKKIKITWLQYNDFRVCCVFPETKLQTLCTLQVPVFRPMDLMVEASPRRVFANAHTYHINSISVNSDCETYLSADDLRINLWNQEITDRSFSKHYLLLVCVGGCYTVISVCHSVGNGLKQH